MRFSPFSYNRCPRQGREKWVEKIRHHGVRIFDRIGVVDVEQLIDLRPVVERGAIAFHE
jgi:hypothetical protein